MGCSDRYELSKEQKAELKRRTAEDNAKTKQRFLDNVAKWYDNRVLAADKEFLMRRDLILEANSKGNGEVNFKISERISSPTVNITHEGTGY